MGLVLAELLLVGYLPGALVFRLPYADRQSRAELTAEERVFWATIISLAISCSVVLLLAAAGRYTFHGLILIDVFVCAALAAFARGDMRLGRAAQAPRPAAIIPVGLVLLGLWLYFPPAEYLLGGRDPGIYTFQGVQIAQSGSLSIPDPLVASVPERFRNLFFPVGFEGYGYRTRFLGFFILDADRGVVGGRFPQFYPASLAIGYGIDGLRGVRLANGVWAILGVLAVYLAGVWLLGRPAAAAAAGVLSLHVAQVWFARYPNSELPMQALLFAGLLACARMESGGQRFFAPVAAGMLGVLVFLRVDAWLVLACVGAAVALNAAMGERAAAAFLVPLATLSLAGLAYLAGFVGPYIGHQVIGVVGDLGPAYWALVVMVLAAGLMALWWIRRHRAATRTWLPVGAVLLAVGGAVYAYFFRHPGSQLAAHDAYALREFTEHYLTPYVLAAALVGYAIAVPRVFWKSPLMVLLMSGFCAVFFYKIRIVPEHFWMARRFLPVILPAFLLFAGAALFYPSWTPAGWRSASLQRLRAVLASLLVAVAGACFFAQTRAILPHVEYAGVGKHIERLAARIADGDLVVIESAAVSDTHVFGPPLAYIYGRKVLVLDSASPDKAAFADAMAWARGRYRNVYFMGGGGTDMLSDTTDAEFAWSESFDVPEYDRPTGRAPGGVKLKKFDFGVHRLIERRQGRPDRFELEIGGPDDLYVTSFYGKEQDGSIRFRWSKARSQVRLRMISAEPTSLTLWASNGGRPPRAEPARTSVYLEGRLLGVVQLDSPAFQPYLFTVPSGATARAAANDGFAVLTIETPTWSPRRALGLADARELGVMVARVELR